MTDLAPMRHGGQTRISTARLQKFIGYVRAGLTLGSAARGIGITDMTRMRWMRRGRLELVRLSDSGIDPTELIDPTSEGWPTQADWQQVPPGFDVYEWPFVLFVLATEKALATFEATQLGIIQRAAQPNGNSPGSWQASAWLLERRMPEKYGRSEVRVRHSIEQETPAGRQAAQAAEGTPVSVEDLEGSLLGLDEADRERGR